MSEGLSAYQRRSMLRFLLSDRSTPPSCTRISTHTTSTYSWFSSFAAPPPPGAAAGAFGDATSLDLAVRTYSPFKHAASTRGREPANNSEEVA